jgi:hypothetical protein
MRTNRLVHDRCALPALALVIATTGCGKAADDHAAAAKTTKATESATTAPEPVKAKHPITAAVLGKVVAPFGPLAQLKRGMPGDAAEKMLDAANEQNDLEGVRWWMGLPDEHHQVDDMLVELPTARRGIIAEAWGPGQNGDRGGHPVTMWFNPETGIRAELSDDKDHSELRFEAYTPLVKLLGDGKQIAMLAKPFVGLTQADLAKAYPELADKDGRLSFPPTEWEFGSGGITISPYPMDGPIKSLAFSIPYAKGDAASKATVLAAIEKKWGKPKPSDEMDLNTKLYNPAGPRVEVTDDNMHPDEIAVRISEPASKPGKKH